MTPPIKVLDSWAIIAFLEDQPAASTVEKILIDALKTGARLLMTTVNLGEVWYSIARAHSHQAANLAVNQVRSLGIEILAVDWDLTLQAAKFKATGRIAYGDCFAAALAFMQGGVLVTGDTEFNQFEDQIKITWV